MWRATHWSQRYWRVLQAAAEAADREARRKAPVRRQRRHPHQRPRQHRLPPRHPRQADPVPPISSTIQDITDGHRVGEARWPNPQTDGSAIGSFNCIVNPPQTLELHAHLTILVQQRTTSCSRGPGAAPGGITHCFYTIHVHDSSGKIHVTPSAAGTFTLGQLFQIWGQPLTNTNVAGITGWPVEIFVTDNGQFIWVAEADWNNIELRSHREITVGLGTSVSEIPNFTWSD